MLKINKQEIPVTWKLRKIMFNAKLYMDELSGRHDDIGF